MDSQSKKTLFQTILLIVFGLAAIVAIAIFAANKGNITKNQDVLTGSLEVWGTLPYDPVRKVFDEMESKYKDLRINYIEKNQGNIEAELVEAMSNGTGPDILTVTPEMLVSNRQRLFSIPYESFPESLFRSTYIDQSNLFLLPEGIIGFPMLIDPMVMYVNNDLFSSAFIVNPPKTWDELLSINNSLTKITDTGEIKQSLVGLGTFYNVTHAQDIITTLLLQSGSNITGFVQGSSTISVIPNNTGGSVFDFYTGFSNKESDFYSYNTSQPNDFDAFIAGKNAIYFGFASELPNVSIKNPNLNFGIHMMPVIGSGQGKDVIYGRITGWGISKMSKNTNAAIQLLQIISSKDVVSGFVNNTWLAPARRDMLAIQPSNDATRALIYKSAIISRGFWNPDVNRTYKTLGQSIERINSGVIAPESGYMEWVADMSNIFLEKQKNIQQSE